MARRDEPEQPPETKYVEQPMQLRGRTGGGKLSRSETVTVRLDPKLNYLCELAARAQRRTKSSFIEWAIDEALNGVGIPGARKPGTGDLYSIDERNSDLWDVDEPDRLIALVAYAPSLLTHDEQLIWKVVATSPYLWRGDWYDDGNDEEVWGYDSENLRKLIMERVREHWDAIKRVADGSDSRENNALLKPKLVRGKNLNPPWSSGEQPRAFDDLDSDLPF